MARLKRTLPTDQWPGERLFGYYAPYKAWYGQYCSNLAVDHLGGPTAHPSMRVSKKTSTGILGANKGSILVQTQTHAGVSRIGTCSYPQKHCRRSHVMCCCSVFDMQEARDARRRVQAQWSLDADDPNQREAKPCGRLATPGDPQTLRRFTCAPSSKGRRTREISTWSTWL